MLIKKYYMTLSVMRQFDANDYIGVHKVSVRVIIIEQYRHFILSCK